jgi:hypothetical protein
MLTSVAANLCCTSRDRRRRRSKSQLKSIHPLLEHLDGHGVVQSGSCDVAKGRAFGGDSFCIGRVRPVGPSSVPFSA